MVMTLVHMICGIDSANHLVPMATPLGREQTHTSKSASLNTYSSFTFLFKEREFKRLLICVADAAWSHVCVEFPFSPSSRFVRTQVCASVCVCVSAQQRGAFSSVLSPVNAE